MYRVIYRRGTRWFDERFEDVQVSGGALILIRRGKVQLMVPPGAWELVERVAD